jgi:hypothetical protein
MQGIHETDNVFSLKCEKCQKSDFKSIVGLRRHLSQIHGSELSRQKYKCSSEGCQYRTTSEQALLKHHQSEHSSSTNVNPTNENVASTSSTTNDSSTKIIKVSTPNRDASKIDQDAEKLAISACVGVYDYYHKDGIDQETAIKYHKYYNNRLGFITSSYKQNMIGNILPFIDKVKNEPGWLSALRKSKLGLGKNKDEWILGHYQDSELCKYFNQRCCEIAQKNGFGTNFFKFYKAFGYPCLNTSGKFFFTFEPESSLHSQHGLYQTFYNEHKMKMKLLLSFMCEEFKIFNFSISLKFVGNVAFNNLTNDEQEAIRYSMHTMFNCNRESMEQLLHMDLNSKIGDESLLDMDKYVEKIVKIENCCVCYPEKHQAYVSQDGEVVSGRYDSQYNYLQDYKDWFKKHFN